MSRTSLTRFAPLMREADPSGAERACAELWHREGGVAFTADQLKRMGGLDRQFLEAAAAKHYGKRN